MIASSFCYGVVAKMLSSVGCGRLFDSENSGERLEIQVQQELGNPTSAMSFVAYLNVWNNLTYQKKKLQKQQQKWGKTKIKA